MGDSANNHLNSRGNTTRSPFYYPAPVFYLAAVLGLAGVLAPLFYWLLDSHFYYPFSRYTDRALLTSAVLLLVPYFVKAWPTLGLSWQKTSRSDLISGLLIGSGSVIAVAVIYLILGSRNWAGHISAEKIFGIAALSIVVALIEEPLFRGGVQQALTARLGTFLGWFTASGFFAIVHFLKVPREFAPEPVTWLSGYKAIGLALEPLAYPETYGAQFFCLLIVGLILGAMFIRTKSLWLPISLHAGWVFGLKLGSTLTVPTDHISALSGGADLLTGSLTAVVLALLGLALWRFYPERSSEIHSKNGA